MDENNQQPEISNQQKLTIRSTVFNLTGSIYKMIQTLHPEEADLDILQEQLDAVAEIADRLTEGAVPPERKPVDKERKEAKEKKEKKEKKEDEPVKAKGKIKK